MECKNPHCQDKSFCAVIEPDSNRIIGIKCLSCGARYLAEDIEIKDKLSFNRKGAWNSVILKNCEINCRDSDKQLKKCEKEKEEIFKDLEKEFVKGANTKENSVEIMGTKAYKKLIKKHSSPKEKK